AEDGIRDLIVTGVQTCALPISSRRYCSFLQSHSRSCFFLVTDKRQSRKEESVRWHLGAGLRTAAPQRNTGYQDNFERALHFCRLRYGEREAALYRRWNLHSERKRLHQTYGLRER